MTTNSWSKCANKCESKFRVSSNIRIVESSIPRADHPVPIPSNGNQLDDGIVAFRSAVDHNDVEKAKKLIEMFPKSKDSLVKSLIEHLI